MVDNRINVGIEDCDVEVDGSGRFWTLLVFYSHPFTLADACQAAASIEANVEKTIFVAVESKNGVLGELGAAASQEGMSDLCVAFLGHGIGSGGACAWLVDKSAYQRDDMFVWMNEVGNTLLARRSKSLRTVTIIQGLCYSCGGDIVFRLFEFMRARRLTAGTYQRFFHVCQMGIEDKVNIHPKFTDGAVVIFDSSKISKGFVLWSLKQSGRRVLSHACYSDGRFAMTYGLGDEILLQAHRLFCDEPTLFDGFFSELVYRKEDGWTPTTVSEARLLEFFGNSDRSNLHVKKDKLSVITFFGGETMDFHLTYKCEPRSSLVAGVHLTFASRKKFSTSGRGGSHKDKLMWEYEFKTNKAKRIVVSFIPRRLAQNPHSSEWKNKLQQGLELGGSVIGSQQLVRFVNSLSPAGGQPSSSFREKPNTFRPTGTSSIYRPPDDFAAGIADDLGGLAVDPGRDGDCLFGALALAWNRQNNNKLSAAQVRAAVCDFLASIPDKADDLQASFEPFLESSNFGNWADYADYMSTGANGDVAGVWGGEPEIKAFGLVFGVTVTVYHPDYQDSLVYNAGQDIVLTIVHNGTDDQHYVAIV